MPKTRNFKELQAKMPPQAHAEAVREASQLLAEMPLQQLREARKLTQESLSKTLGVRQATISKLEHRTDMYISTLASFIRAMGGELEIRAVFPDGIAVIDQFENNRPGSAS